MFKKVNAARVALVTALTAVVAPAFAAGETGAQAAFTGAITSVSADIAVYGAALVGVAVIGVGFMVGMKYVKKIRGAA